MAEMIEVHRLAPAGAARAWAAWTGSWPGHGLRQRVWHDEDVAPLVRRAFPSLAPRILALRSLVERLDIARLAIMYLHGGVYADLDMELRSAPLLRCAVRLRRVILPFEVGRLIGQSILISPPRQPFWRELSARLVRGYNKSCYEPMNTGPDAITRVWNEHYGICGTSRSVAGGADVLIVDGFTQGPVTFHHLTGSWRKGESIARRRGERGCTFVRQHLRLRPRCTLVLNFTFDFARRMKCPGV
ncbi:hypothetical protein AB1Y20_006872 [Prymnesium parvum]|uniref:Alpha-1,4-N-acetylglucosaminyltransferase n=1 Tax=Prymnesium parvum TaxID=97485 RepID=A0AB34J049_PRYPA